MRDGGGGGRLGACALQSVRGSGRPVPGDPHVPDRRAHHQDPSGSQGGPVDCKHRNQGSQQEKCIGSSKCDLGCICFSCTASGEGADADGCLSVLQGSGAHQHLSRADARPGQSGSHESRAGEALDNVGLVVWQSAFVLAELLMSHPPLGPWHDVRVVDLGTGTGQQTA